MPSQDHTEAAAVSRIYGESTPFVVESMAEKAEAGTESHAPAVAGPRRHFNRFFSAGNGLPITELAPYCSASGADSSMSVRSDWKWRLRSKSPLMSPTTRSNSIFLSALSAWIRSSTVPAVTMR